MMNYIRRDISELTCSVMSLKRAITQRLTVDVMSLFVDKRKAGLLFQLS